MAGTIITKKGMILIAKLLASNQELVFTRAAVGTGSAPHGWDPAGMIGLNQYKMDGKISSCHSENEEATVVFQISSTDVESGFVITEAGIFAEDPDEGEILYAYLDLSDDPQYVYAKNSVVQKFAEIEFKTVVGAIENITVITSPDALVTKEVFEKEIDALNNPEFEDYSAEGAEAPDARTAIEEIKSKKSIFGIMSNIKAALKGLVTLGEMKELLVNNGLCNIPGQYFLDAAFGKNLQDQVTDVNNNFYKFVGGISIPQGADLYSDTYKIPGNYYCPMTNTALTLKNCPCTNAFTMKVELGAGTGYPQQIFKNLFGQRYFRVYNSDNGGWYQDTEYPSKNEIFGEDRKYNTDLNTIMSPGVWWCSISGTGLSPQDYHYPFNSVNGWLYVFKTGGSLKQIFYRYGTINTTDNFIYIRTYHNEQNNWSNWVTIATEYIHNPPNKNLWTGTFDQGSITIPNFEKYTLFRITMSGKATDIIATRHTDHLRGFGGFSDGKGVSGFFFNASVSGNVITLVACIESNFTNSVIKPCTISGIYGLC